VNFDPNHYWSGTHFHGQSISQCYELCKKYDYDIVELHYNNLFLVARELNTYEALSPEKAYEIGYKNKADRKKKFYWNHDMEDLMTMNKEDSIQFIKKKFEANHGKFTVE
jgi:hypothetical protein